MTHKKIQNVAFVINAKKAGAQALGEELVSLSKELKLNTKISFQYPLPKDFLKKQDLCCVLGGDGTILSTVTQSVKEQVPILGVNQGKLGFLATFSPELVRHSWKDILEGQFQIDYRCVLKCLYGQKHTSLALNDIVIKSQNPARLIQLEVSIQDSKGETQRITEYSCDGLLFATPTGSTAYNLSAGGPIVHPATKAIVMTPICPHTLSNRTLIFNDNTLLSIVCKNTEDTFAHITADGQLLGQGCQGDPLNITISKKLFPLLHPTHYEHFKIIRNKLKWG